MDDTAMKNLLKEAKTIAVVGHSDKPHRTSYRIANYLREAGYTVYPVNPTVTDIEGETSYPTIEAIPDEIDIVDVFRRSEYLPEIVSDAIAAGAKSVWTQLGVVHDEAAQQARDTGLDVVVDKCIMVEHRRLGVT